MSSRRKKWLLAAGLMGLGALVALFLIGRRMARQFEPYIKQQSIEYLRKRFESEVEIGSLDVKVPNLSPTRLVFSRGRGVMAMVEGAGIVMRHRGRRDLPPLFAVKSFRFEADLGRVFEPVKHIVQVRLEGMEIHVPPKGDRPQFSASEAGENRPEVIIDDVEIVGARLVLLPKRKDRKPFEFQLHDVHLKSAGLGRPMDYTARLTNPRPPGKIESKGTFGPWNAETPGDTALAGDYIFTGADLGVFPAIAGILHSTGKFDGVLSDLRARGEASVPDFRLRRSGNRVPLKTTFEAEVDGTNGNTILKPVRAVLGSTHFVTSGAIIKNDGDPRRTIGLHVNMPAGNLADIMRLAVPGPPMMEGKPIQLLRSKKCKACSIISASTPPSLSKTWCRS